MEFLNNPKINKIPHNTVIAREQQKFNVLLLTLSPIGITKKFPINSEIPKNIPFIYIFDNPNLYGIKTDKA